MTRPRAELQSRLSPHRPPVPTWPSNLGSILHPRPCSCYRHSLSVRQTHYRWLARTVLDIVALAALAIAARRLRSLPNTGPPCRLMPMRCRPRTRAAVAIPPPERGVEGHQRLLLTSGAGRRISRHLSPAIGAAEAVIRHRPSPLRRSVGPAEARPPRAVRPVHTRTATTGRLRRIADPARPTPVAARPRPGAPVASRCAPFAVSPASSVGLSSRPIPVSLLRQHAIIGDARFKPVRT